MQIILADMPMVLIGVFSFLKTFFLIRTSNKNEKKRNGLFDLAKNTKRKRNGVFRRGRKKNVAKTFFCLKKRFFATGLYPSLDHLKIFQAPQAKNLTNFHLFHIFFIKENIQSAQIFACGASGNITFQLCKDLKIIKKNSPAAQRK